MNLLSSSATLNGIKGGLSARLYRSAPIFSNGLVLSSDMMLLSASFCEANSAKRQFSLLELIFFLCIMMLMFD